MDACSNSVAKLVFKGLQRYVKFWPTDVKMSFAVLQVKSTDNGIVHIRKLGVSELGGKT